MLERVLYCSLYDKRERFVWFVSPSPMFWKESFIVKIKKKIAKIKNKIFAKRALDMIWKESFIVLQRSLYMTPQSPKSLDLKLKTALEIFWKSHVSFRKEHRALKIIGLFCKRALCMYHSEKSKGLLKLSVSFAKEPYVCIISDPWTLPWKEPYVSDRRAQRTTFWLRFEMNSRNVLDKAL